ncbi:MAG: hypothetical protein KIT73_08630 [Burkholderiales bacterium]|nr:hypothetical protein [Burkholderiales bacterium]
MKRFMMLPIIVVFLLSGCVSTYLPPGDKADLQALAPQSIQEGFAAKPVATFPVSIAVAHVQSPDYASYTVQQSGGSGAGRYSVITAREPEEQAELDRLSRLPQVAGLVSLNRLLLPPRLESDKELREAAARLQADLVLLYTYGTIFFDTNTSRSMSAISLGFSLSRKVSVTTTASALLMDTRTGYVYSAYEVTARKEARSSWWASRDTADEGRRSTEHEAFARLMDEIVKSWPALLERHGKKT